MSSHWDCALNHGAKCAEVEILLDAVANGIANNDFCDVCDREVGNRDVRHQQKHADGCLYAKLRGLETS